MIKVGIAGAAGYTGGELIRLLLHHPECELSFTSSRSQSGKPVTSVHTDLKGECDMIFDATPGKNTDVVFLAMGHGESQKILAENPFTRKTKIIDLSQDFRDESAGFVYGLPEAGTAKIIDATKIANPGCFATAIQLALLPAVSANGLSGNVHVHAITGSTGAGVSPGPTTHFSRRHGNASVYKAFRHQHVAEIIQTLVKKQSTWQGDLLFVPMRGAFTRGILASVYFETALSEKEWLEMYKIYYTQKPFVFIADESPDVKQVVNTSKCILHLEKIGNMLHIVSVIDNLIKGAAGQAVQNMNLMCGLPEETGLRLKPVAF